MTRAHVTAAAPWRRAPLRLLRQPRLLGAALLVAVVVGLVAATPLLFLSSVSSGAIAHQLAPLCRGTSIDPSVRAGGDMTPIVLAAAQVDGFEPPSSTLLLTGSIGRPLEGRAAGGAKPVIVGTRTGYADHLQPIGPTAGRSCPSGRLPALPAVGRRAAAARLRRRVVERRPADRGRRADGTARLGL